MKPWKIIFLFIAIPPVQALLNHLLGEKAAYYDLYLILIVTFSMLLSILPAIYIAMLSGMIKDLLAGPIVGLNGFSFPLIALASGFIYNRFPIIKAIPQFFLLFFLTLINNLIIALLCMIFSIKITHLTIIEYLYMGLANGILFVFIFNIKKVLPRRKPKKSTKYAL